MAFATPTYQPYLARLHMRVSTPAHKRSMKGEKLSDSQLRKLYRNPTAIRSKYKGARGQSRQQRQLSRSLSLSSPSSPSNSFGRSKSSPIFDFSFSTGSPPSSKDPIVNQPGHTSGIPIFGEDDSSARTGWSVGHTFQRSTTKTKLAALAKQRRLRKHVVAENSHALGHGDYGVDHLLSAPPASKAQNTEQLAIELGMRQAAQKLNAQHGLGTEHSLVHAKISDVIHPQTGQLLARRFKLIRRANADDKEGKVVFDHLMDGQRIHISKQEAMKLGAHVHDSLMDDGSAFWSSYKPVAPYSADDGQGPRGGTGGITAPTRTGLRLHQANVLKALQQKRKGVSIKDRFSLKDRKGVPMVGPAFTGVSFPPATKFGQRQIYSGQQALVEARRRAMKNYTNAPVDSDFVFHHSGSVPSDADSLMHAGMQSLRARFKETYRTSNPTREQLATMPLRSRMGIADAYNKVRNSGGDRSLLEDHEREQLAHLDKIRRQSLSAPRGKIIYRFDLSPSISSNPFSKKPRARTASTMLAQPSPSSFSSPSQTSRMKRDRSGAPMSPSLLQDDYADDDDTEEVQSSDSAPEQRRKRRRKMSDRPSPYPLSLSFDSEDW